MRKSLFSASCFSISFVLSLIRAIINDSVLSLIAALFFLAAAIAEVKNLNHQSKD